MAPKRRRLRRLLRGGDAARKERDVPTRLRKMDHRAPTALGDGMAKRKGRRGGR